MNRKLQKECESSCEYILPDYMGDVKKLLHSKARVIPSGKFVGEGSIEVTGSVEYDILYLDAEGKLTAVNAASDFTEEFITDTEKHSDSSEESRVSSFKVRVTGPRKISLKADVETLLTISEDSQTAIEGNVFEGDEKSVEKCSEEVRFATSLFINEKEREYAEILEKLEGVTSDEVEIISSSAVCAVKEGIAGEGEVTVKGENIVTVILSLPERAPTRIKKAFPFEERIEAEGARADMFATAEGCVSSVNIGMGADGDELNLVANVICEYKAELIENSSLNVVTDAYTTDGVTENEYCDAKFSELIFAGQKELTVEVRTEKNEERLSSLSELIALSATARPMSMEISSKDGALMGEITVSGVGYETNVDGSIDYIPIKMQGDFSEKVNLSFQNSPETLVECHLDVKDCEVINEPQYLVAKCLLTAKIYASKTKTVKVLSRCESRIDSKIERDSSVITVYYPKDGERLFDVAKKYRTTSAKIAKDNELAESALASFDSPASLKGVKKLIIR